MPVLSQAYQKNAKISTAESEKEPDFLRGAMDRLPESGNAFF